MTTPHWTMFFAGVCALLQCALAALVIMRRAQTGIGFLDGGDAALLHRIRAHGNFAETVPMALLLLALLEMQGLGRMWIISLGAVLLLGRLLHALSLLTNNAAWSRRGGMLLTLNMLSIAAVLCIGLALR